MAEEQYVSNDTAHALSYMRGIKGLIKKCVFIA